MVPVEQLKAWAAALPAQHYYAILQVRFDASTRDIVVAFHSASLKCHPDRYVGDGPEAYAAATEIFKRVVEAYTVLKNPELRKRYNVGLKKHNVLRLDTSVVPEPPPKPEARTLEMIARDERAKAYAKKADVLLSVGNLEDARIALVSAIQHDLGNTELEERLNILYEALALEPG